MTLVMKFEVDRIKELLKEKGLRCTDARVAIYSHFLETNKPLSIQNFKTNKKFSDFDESSLYRNFSKLDEAGLIRLIPSSGDFQYYEATLLTHEHHHHHITCTKCAKITCLDSCGVDSQLKKMAKEVGYKIEGHKLELYGLCQECSA